MRLISVVLFYVVLIAGFAQRSTAEITYDELILIASLLAASVTLLITLVTRRRIPKCIAGAVFFAYIWLPFNVLWAVFNGVDLELAIRRAASLFGYVITFLLSIFIFRSFKDIRAAYISLASGAAVVVLWSLLQATSVHHEGLYLQEFRRATHVMGGYHSVLAMLLTLPLVVSPRGPMFFEKLTAFAVFLIGTIGLLLSLTRTYWIVALISVLLFVLISRRNRIRLFFMILASSLSVLLLDLGVVSGERGLTKDQTIQLISQRVADFRSITEDPSVLNRVQELLGGLQSLLEEPQAMVLGRGLGREFAFVSVDPFYPKGAGVVFTDYSHNFYLYLLLQMGIPGLLLVVGSQVTVVLGAIRWMMRQNPEYHRIDIGYGLLITVFGLLIANLVAPPMLFAGVSSHIGAIVGMLLKLQRIDPLPAPNGKAGNEAVRYPDHYL